MPIQCTRRKRQRTVHRHLSGQLSREKEQIEKIHKVTKSQKMLPRNLYEGAYFSAISFWLLAFGQQLTANGQQPLFIQLIVDAQYCCC